jgi:hypothetical protein
MKGDNYDLFRLWGTVTRFNAGCGGDTQAVN